MMYMVRRAQLSQLIRHRALRLPSSIGRSTLLLDNSVGVVLLLQ